MDFPGNAVTNVYVLHDFTDIAWAVCVATPLPNDDVYGGSGPESVETQNGFSTRLRAAEIGIRKLGLLVSFDGEKREIFTFFRRADLQRDGKGIFDRLLAVLKSNGCIVSSKKAARAVDMLKVENVRIHRLFISAIYPSIRSKIIRSYEMIPLGMGTFVSEHQFPGDPADFAFYQGKRPLCLVSASLQLLAGGQLLLSLQNDECSHLLRSMNQGWGDPMPETSTQARSMLVLAPSGRIARVVNKCLGHPPGTRKETEYTETFEQQAPQTFGPRKQETWKSRVEKWLSDQGLEMNLKEEEDWLEVEISMRAIPQPDVEVGSPDAVRSGMLRRLWWPASLCFQIADTATKKAEALVENLEIGDSLRFIEDWYLDSDRRAKRQEERTATKAAISEPEAGSTEFETFQRGPLIDSSPSNYRHTIVDAPFGNNIYPTPPDGALSQVTPGMSSVDGIAVTPAEPSQRLPGTVNELGNEMVPEDAMEFQQGNQPIGTGTYDEDLFGDMPGETFGASSIADEPNWDFFDEPDLDMLEDENVPINSRGFDELNRLDDANGRSDMALDDLDVQDMIEEQVDDAHLATTENASLSSEMEMNDESEIPAAMEVFDKDLEVFSPSSPNMLYQQPSDHPLSAQEVKKALNSSAVSPTIVDQSQVTDVSPLQRPRRESHYESLPLTHKSIPQDERYSANGRFFFGGDDPPQERATSQIQTMEIPKIRIFGQGAHSRSLIDAAGSANNSMIVDIAQPRTPASIEDSDFDSTEFFSNDQISIDANAEDCRKWTDYTPASPEIMEPETDPQNDIDIQNDCTQLLECMQSDATNIVDIIFRASTEHSDLSTGNSTDDIRIAQILVDQVTQSSLAHGVFPVPEFRQAPPHASNMIKELSETHGEVENVTLDQLSSLKRFPEDQPQARISKLDASMINMKREEKPKEGKAGAIRPLSASPTILPFWDALGLHPASGRKNITAFCILPYGTAVVDGCTIFMERIGEAYGSCNLGAHTVGKIAGTTNDGLMAWSSTSSSLPDLVQSCERLATALSRLPASKDTIMIYMINCSKSPSSLLDICNAFVSLFSTYMKTCGKREPNEIALQIIPLTFVALPDTLAIPSQAEYNTLAIEVYNRCPPSDIGDQIASCGSAVTLNENRSKQIEFDLDTAAQTPFAREGKCLHLAYSQSNDKRWISAAWTDDIGKTSLVMSYCLRQRGSGVSRPVSDVIKELWEVSFDMMKKNRTKWRVVVARDGHVEPSELNEWAVLANQDVERGPSLQYCLVLLAIETRTDLWLRPPSGSGKQGQNSISQQHSGIYGTPSSTPQASTTSPDHNAVATSTPGGSALNAPTPPEHGLDANTETDLTLSDPADESWSVILPYGLDQSDALLEARPALASGYLLKRGGAGDMESLIALEVSIVHCANTPPSHRQDLLKEILLQYKGLVTLAKTRGMMEPANCVMPWHIATALKGQQVLSMIM